MKVGRLEIYAYPVPYRKIYKWKNYTGDEFYGKDRVFRWEVILFSHAINIMMWKAK